MAELLSHDYHLRSMFTRSPITQSIKKVVDHANFIELFSYSHPVTRTAIGQISHARWTSLDGNVQEEKLFCLSIMSCKRVEEMFAVNERPVASLLTMIMLGEREACWDLLGRKHTGPVGV